VIVDKTKTYDGTPAMTAILKINLETGEMTNRVIFDRSGEQFTTYVERDYIFKMIKSRAEGAVITIYNLHTFKLCKTFKIVKETPLAKNRAFLKDFTRTVEYGSAWDAISNTSTGFITATSTDSINYTIRVGAHRAITKSNSPFIPLLPSYPILFFAGTALRVLTYSPAQIESVDKYFYLTWNTVNEPVFSDKPSSTGQAIDAYDLSLFKQKRTFEYRGYIQRASDVLGIYKETGSAFVDILSFQTNRSQ
jgi:hypothetical protein